MAVYHVCNNESCSCIADDAALASTAIPLHTSATAVCLGINGRALRGVAAVTERTIMLGIDGHPAAGRTREPWQQWLSLVGVQR